MKPVSWLLILLLIVLHQDYWNWDNEALWFGFLPIQLAYHIVISLLAAAELVAPGIGRLAGRRRR